MSVCLHPPAGAAEQAAHVASELLESRPGKDAACRPPLPSKEPITDYQSVPSSTALLSC